MTLACPGEDCLMCSGEVCNLCGAGMWRNQKQDGIPCDHDSVERHAEAPVVTSTTGKR